MQIVDAWTRDMPQQFQSKHNINILIGAFAKQLEEINNVLCNINGTDIDKSSSKQLDMIGNIVSMSRKDATAIVRKASDTYLSDDVYRQVIKYKILKNNCECTYYDIMHAIELLWNTDYITYIEDVNKPAMIELALPEVGIDSMDPALGRILSIKPSGVGLLYTIAYIVKFLIMLEENARLDSVDFKMIFPFWNETRNLDGSWMLDGSWSLSGPLQPVKIGVGYTAYKINHSESFMTSVCYQSADVFNNSNIVKINSICISSKFNTAQSINTSIVINQSIMNDESINVELVTTSNLWELDGTHNLDGEMLLNAYRKKEEL